MENWVEFIGDAPLDVLLRLGAARPKSRPVGRDAEEASAADPPDTSAGLIREDSASGDEFDIMVEF